MRITIKRPVITEKTLTLATKGWYTFAVDSMASKKTVAHEVASFYKVTVEDVRTIAMHGKVRRVGRSGRSMKKPDWKKAIVKLAKGQKIDAFEVAPVSEEKK